MQNELQEVKSIDTIVIDSLKIRIPIGLVKNLDNLELATQTFIPLTGEVVSTDIKRQRLIIENGIKTTFWHWTEPNTGNEFLTIGFNSKALKQNYFDGITADTIKQIYYYIISLNIVSFTFTAFMNAFCTDTDFKKDIRCTEKDFKDFIHSAIYLTKSSPKCGYGYSASLADKKLILGFSERGKATYGNPFFKFYHKTLELKYHSMEFANQYLNDIDYNDILRIEATVKDKGHYKRFDVLDTSLQSVLNLTTEQKENIIKNIASEHMNSNVEPPEKQSNDLTPTNKALLANMQLVIKDHQWTFEQYYNYISESCNYNPIEKSRMKKTLYALYAEYIGNTEIVKTIEKTHEILRAISLEV